MKKILLHTCCGPCFSGSFDQIKDDFRVDIFWYNPNIEPKSEHDKRFETLISYLQKIGQSSFSFDYDYKKENLLWHQFVEGLENEPEGGKRCKKCFAFRLSKAASLAKSKDMGFATTLSISPYKNSSIINEIGQHIGNDKKVYYLSKDFQQNNGYTKSLELFKKHGLYRQKYCGCRYSLNR